METLSLSMATEAHQKLHVFFFPLFAPGHMIPLVDMARLFATRDVKVTIITTPLNVNRFQSIIDRDVQSGAQIQFHVLEFPCTDAGLPEGCENADILPSRDLSFSFIKATTMLQPQFEQLVQTHIPDAIISDLNLPWTAEVAGKYEIPRLVFHGSCCFSLSIALSVNGYMPHKNVTSDSEPFLVPGLPDPVRVTKAQLPERSLGNMGLREFFQKVREADRTTSAAVVNSFYDLEPDYIEHYQKITGKKVWTLGPLSLCNGDSLNKAERGNKSSIDRHRCLDWLDSKKPKSVLYVCFGSLCRFSESQLLEIALGLEASNQSFIWVIRDVDGALPEGFEERVQGRGLIIRGWAPQVLILDHPAVGGFMSHCGWNSVIEAVSAGLPLITWPLFAEQFYNEKLVLQRLRIGIGIGVERGLEWGEEESMGALVKKEQVVETVTRLMGGGCGGEEVDGMRKRASQLGELARSAVGKEGSSYVNMSLLIKDLAKQRREKLAREKSLAVES